MKSKFKIKNLGDFITEISVRNNKKDVGEVFSVTNSEGFIKSTDYFDKEVFSKNIGNYKIVSPNQFAYNPSRINVGSIAFLKTDFDVAISPLYVVFECKQNLLPEYLLRYLKSPVGISQIRNRTRGAVRDTLSFSSLSEINIPIPSISEQRKIVKLLLKADALLEKRKTSLILLDTILTNLFHELFGNPVRNEKGWRVDEFNKYLLEIVAGSSTGGEEKETLSENEIGILKVSAVTKGRFNAKEFKVVRKEHLGSRLVNPKQGDLLFSRANTRELVAATCIVDKDYPNLYLPDKLWVLRVNESVVNKIFLHFLFQNSFFKTRFTLNATGSNSSMLNISMEKLREANIPIPPIELQKQFSKVYYEVEKTRLAYENSLTLLRDLYNSISSNAFKGEIDLINVDLDHIIPVSNGGNDSDKNIDIFPRETNISIGGKKGSVLKTIVNTYFKNKTFNFQQLADKIQESLNENEYDYNKIKNEVFNSLKGKGDIQLKQLFNEKDKSILLQKVE